MSFHKLFCIIILNVLLPNLYAQPVSRSIRTSEYNSMQAKINEGWNTWYNNSVISHVLLPEKFSINLCLSKNGGWNSNYGFIKEAFKASKVELREENITLGLRSNYGDYTSLNIEYKNCNFNIQSAIDGKDQLVLIQPIGHSDLQLVVEVGLLWNASGAIGRDSDYLYGEFGSSKIKVHSTVTPIEDRYVPATSPCLVLPLSDEVGLYTGDQRSLSEIKDIMVKKRNKQENFINSYGELSEQFRAIQTILSWNTIYDAPNKRSITPVSRNWNKKWGGFVMFDWDTYFASYMFSLFNKEMAYANAIEITKAITPEGFIPNYQSPFGNTSWDRSQPPIGSEIILRIFNKYHEKWFLQEVYDELLTWNRWWEKNREYKGYLCWGSNNVPDNLKTIEKHNIDAAKLESGLDNSPMYDGVPFNETENVMELADVGLLSLYIMDCKALIKISEILNKTAEIKELKSRVSKYSKALKSLWNDDFGLYLNKRLDTGEFSYRISPTNFYPLLTKIPSQKQAQKMITLHYFNEKEFYGKYVIPSIARNDPAFKDNTYWRGRIWAPLNFLVYLGMNNYKLDKAKSDLIHRSNDLFMKSWKENGAVYENYNTVSGVGDDVKNSDGFYHWGALLSFMSFIEQGYLLPSDN